MFRRMPGIPDGPIERTFENARKILEPTLFVKQLSIEIEDLYTDFEGEFFPIPFFFDVSALTVQKAWVKGDLDIRHITNEADQSGGGGTSTVTVYVVGAAYGGTPAVLSTVVITLPGAAATILSQDYLPALDLSAYDAIGLRYTTDAAPVDPFTVSTSLLWRPLPA